MDQEVKTGLKRLEAQREQFNNYLILTLLVLVLLLLAVLVKAVLISPVKTPRTALERDIMDFSARIKKDENDTEAYFGLGLAYLKMGAYSKAAAQFQEAVERQPANDKYNFYLVNAYRQQGNFAAAEKAVKKALKLNLTSAALYLEQGRLALDQQKYNLAISAFKKSIKIVPESSDSQYYLGLAYEKKGQKQQAAYYYKQALKYVPDYQPAKEGLKRIEVK